MLEQVEFDADSPLCGDLLMKITGAGRPRPGQIVYTWMTRSIGAGFSQVQGAD